MYSHTIQQLASEQYGVFSRRQALALAIGESQIVRRIRSGQWDVVHPGVYRISGAPPTWSQRLQAAVLWGGDAAVVSHGSAAVLWGLDGEWGQPVEITVPYGRLAKVGGATVHRTRRLADRDTGVRSRLPVTRVERTLIDLTRRLDHDALEVALESSVRMGLTGPTALWRRIDAHVGRLEVGELRRLLVLRQPEIAQSRWEVKLLQLIRDGGLPEPLRQFRVWDGEQWRKVDLAYPDVKVALEYDSYTWHSGRRAWERDHTRNTALIAEGWRVFPITLDDVELHPKRTLSHVSRLLGV